MWVPMVMKRWRELHGMAQHKDYQTEEKIAEVRGESLRLLECVACGAVAMGGGFSVWAKEALER